MLKRVAPAFAGLVAVAVAGHRRPVRDGPSGGVRRPRPRGPRRTSGYSPYLSWQGAEESVCISESVDEPLRRLRRQADAVRRDRHRRTCGCSPSRPSRPHSRPEGAFNSDLAFENGCSSGRLRGRRHLGRPRATSRPTLVNQIHCPGSQNDVTINDGILITSTDSRRTNGTVPNSTSTSTPDRGRTTWEGLKVWDVSDPTEPALRKSVRTDCGSHTHTVLPEADRLIVYVGVATT